MILSIFLHNLQFKLAILLTYIWITEHSYNIITEKNKFIFGSFASFIFFHDCAGLSQRFVKPNGSPSLHKNDIITKLICLNWSVQKCSIFRTHHTCYDHAHKTQILFYIFSNHQFMKLICALFFQSICFKDKGYVNTCTKRTRFTIHKVQPILEQPTFAPLVIETSTVTLI